VPRHIRFVDAFPMTITGKRQKFVMRKESIEAMGLTEHKTV
jgi:fatty-acyl-CoA synthase